MLLDHLRVSCLETGIKVCVVYICLLQWRWILVWKEAILQYILHHKTEIAKKMKVWALFTNVFCSELNALHCFFHTHTFLNSGIWEAETGSKEWRPAGVQVWGARESWEVQTEREQHRLQANQPLYFRYINQTRLFNTMRFLLGYMTWLPHVSVDKSKDEGSQKGSSSSSSSDTGASSSSSALPSFWIPSLTPEAKPTLIKKPVGL